MYGWCCEPKNYCIVMELVEGGNLYDLIHLPQSSLKDNLPVQLSLCKQATMAINYLHFKKIIHRDIKSPNFLVMNDILFCNLYNLNSLQLTGFQRYESKAV